jgi:hypothetical protein
MCRGESDRTRSGTAVGRKTAYATPLGPLIHLTLHSQPALGVEAM